MPVISFFADERDLPVLLERLNADPEIAFIVPDGPLDPQEAYVKRLQESVGIATEAVFYSPFEVVDDGYQQRWKTVKTVDSLKDGNHSLWHVPTGPLPLLAKDGSMRAIPDPWTGWTEERPGADPLVPYFAELTAEIRLELWTRHQSYTDAEKESLPVLISYWNEGHDLLAVSGFQWIGNHYRPASQCTCQWWNRLLGWMDQVAIRIADFTDLDEDTGQPETSSFWAFPSALQLLKSGMAYYARGYNLDEGIQVASG